MKLTVANLVFFKLGWLAVVFGAASELALQGTLVVCAVALFHLIVAVDAKREVRLLLIAAAVGFSWETLMTGLQIVDYGEASPLAPYWIVAMWVLFATTLNVGMRWLQKNQWLPIVFGALGGPLSFVAGERIGAVTFPNTTLSLIVIGLGWAVLLPLMVIVARRNDGTQALALKLSAVQS